MNSFQGRKINPSRLDWSQAKIFAVLIPMAVVMILPIIYIFATAFKPLDELFAYPPRFFVRKFTLKNFKDIITAASTMGIPFSRYLFNSVASTFLVVVLTIFIALSAGYVLSKKNFKAKKLLFTINTLSMMFVPAAVGIPRYLIISKTHLINTFAILVLPLLAMPVGLFLVKQFIDGVPDSLVESAKMDGANDYYILFKIIAPVVSPALVTVGMLAFQAGWNAVEASNIYITNDALKTLPFYMSVLTSQANVVAGAGMAAAASLIQFMPNLIMFVVLQSKVVNTMAYSGIK